MIGAHEGPKNREQLVLNRVRDHLELDKTDTKAGMSKVLALLAKRTVDKISNESDIIPMLSLSEKWIILPDGFKNEDYHIGQYMITIAHLLGLEVHLVKFLPEKRDIPADFEKRGTGIYLSLCDFDRKILAKKGKKDDVELGRAIVRGQQIIRLFQAEELGLDALTHDHAFFGNDPGEKDSVPRVYLAKTLDNLFEEKEWAEELRKILCTLMRESAQLLSERSQQEMVNEYLITRSQLIHYYCSTTSSETVGRGKKAKTVKTTRLAHKPRMSPLLEKNEAAVIGNLSNSIFTQPSSSEEENWVEYILGKSFSKVRALLQSNYKVRNEFLENYSRLTTTRLVELKKGSANLRYKKKKDVTSTDLTSLLGSRKDPYSQLARELSRFDQTWQGILVSFRINIPGTQKVDPNESLLRLTSYLKELRVYEASKIAEESGVTPDPPAKSINLPEGPPKKVLGSAVGTSDVSKEIKEELYTKKYKEAQKEFLKFRNKQEACAEKLYKHIADKPVGDKTKKVIYAAAIEQLSGMLKGMFGEEIKDWEVYQKDGKPLKYISVKNEFSELDLNDDGTVLPDVLKQACRNLVTLATDRSGKTWQEFLSVLLEEGKTLSEALQEKLNITIAW
jgi:hypothetical protein